MASRVRKPLVLDRTIIIGCGKLGSMIANEKWKEGKNVVVIDCNNTSFFGLDKEFSGITVLGDAMDISYLEEAGIKQSSEIIIVTGKDNVNIFLAHLICKKYDIDADIFVRLDDAEREIALEKLPVKTILPTELSFSRYNQCKRRGGR